MLKVNEVVNGRIYSFVFNGPVRMNKGGRGGIAVNPLIDVEVTRRMVVSIQACTRASYARRMLKQDANWTHSTRVSSFTATDNPCIDQKDGEFFLRGWACGVTKNEVFVGGKPATETELAIIAQYRPAGKDDYGFMRLPLAKIEHEGWQDGNEE